MITLDEILALFPYNLRAGNGYLVECPLHDDQIGSLSVALKQNKKGFNQIFFHCQANCLGDSAAPNVAAYNRLLGILGYTKWDLTSQPQPSSNGHNGNGRASKYAHLLEDITAVYDYKDETGKLLYQCVKYDTKAQKAKGRTPAKCRMRQPGNAPGYFKWNLDNTRLVLYRFPELLNSDQDDYVFIVEGEKDVERLRKEGLIATCNPTGAGKWQDEYSGYLENRICIIIPDNDEPGKNHAEDVYNSLLKFTPNVTARILELEKLPTKGDISDWFDLGNTADALRQLAESALAANTAQQTASQTQAPPPPSQPTQTPWSGQIKTYNTTDMGNAERFVDKFGDRVRYCSKLGKDGVWLIWDGARWQIDEKLKIHRLAKDIVPDIYLEAHACSYKADKERYFKWAVQTEGLATRNNMVKDARPMIAVAAEELDTHLWKFNAQNGTLNLVTGKIEPHNQNDYLTKLSPIRFDDQAQCPNWLDYLHKAQHSKQDMVEYLQKAVGYSMTGDISEKCMFILHGPKNTGKTTFIEIMQMLLAEYAIKIQTQTLMWRREKQQSNDIAVLKGARFVHASEAEEHERLAEAQIKEMTGGDTITARFMYAEFFQFQPEFKLWLSTNHKPKASNDDALWGRLKLIPFTNKIPEDQIDRKLRGKLKAELSGILKWAVEGCLKWQKEGLGTPPDVIKATDDYRGQQDYIGHFLDEHCELDPAYSEMAKDLYSAYKQWCIDAGEKIESQRAFGFKLNDRGLANRKTTGGRHEWIGIRLIPQQGTMGF